MYRERSVGLFLAFVLGKEGGECEVIELDEAFLLVAADLPDGASLAECRLRREDESPITIGSLQVTAARDGRARLVPVDTATRAQLWRVQRGFHARSAAATAPARMPRMPVRGHQDEHGRLKRLEWLRAQTGALLLPLQQTRLVPEKLTSNVEYLIGAVEVPVGLAGPLVVHGQHAEGIFYAPLATTEGALVASCARGALAISRSGGVHTRVLHQRMTRVPMFVMNSSRAAIVLSEWARDHVDELREQVALVSHHAKLISVEPHVTGTLVNLAFVYETGDAAGQNMTTACTWQVCQWLMRELRFFDDVVVERFAIEGNMSGDKKVTYQSMLVGRGVRVTADCVLADEVLQKVLGTSSDELLFLHGCGMGGAAQIGMIGYNVNVANVVAAIFTATGQDIASVHESSLGVLSLHRVAGGVHASLVLPALVIGTVGGGTHLPAQHALLEMMGCAGAGKARRLAELIAGFALSLEVSTLSAVATGEFASAHDRMGRNRPVKWFSRADLTPEFFAPALRAAVGDPQAVVERIETFELSTASSILGELTTRKLKKLVGLEPVRLIHRGGAVDVVVKAKALAEETMLMMDSMVLLCDARAWATWIRTKEQTQFVGTHLREIEVCRQTDPRFVRHAPAVHHTVVDPTREAYVLVLERLEDVVLMDSADDCRGWTSRAIEAALDGIAEVHAIWLGREAELRAQPWLGPAPSTSSMEAMRDLFDAFAVHGAEELPEIVGEADLELTRRLIRTIGDWWPTLEAVPRTLIHHDFNPRNLAFRREGDGLRLCAYDWELATLHAPQRDLAELLSFVLGPSATRAEMDRWVEHHRLALEKASGTRLDRELWYRGFTASLKDLLVNRLGFYLVGQTFRHYAFLPRVYQTCCHLLRLAAGERKD